MALPVWPVYNLTDYYERETAPPVEEDKAQWKKIVFLESTVFQDGYIFAQYSVCVCVLRVRARGC